MKLVEKKRLQKIGIDTSGYKDCIFYLEKSDEVYKYYDLIIKDINTNEIIDTLCDEFDKYDVEELLREED